MRRLIFFLLVSLALLLFQASPTFALEDITYTVTVTATVGEPKLTVFGYTSPQAKVKLEGIGVSKETIADEEGYFLLDRVFLPQPTPRFVSNYRKAPAYPQLHLTAIDTGRRSTAPLSLPELPIGPYNISVGPVLLSPTITIEKGKFLPHEQITASGQTIPNTKVTISLANKTDKGFIFSGSISKFLLRFFTHSPLSYFFPIQIYAYYIPSYQVKADSQGDFQFNLPANPAASGADWRVFAATQYLDSPSPKSNTLSFKVLNFWQWLWEQVKAVLGFVLGFLRPFLWYLLLLAEILLLGFIVLKIKKHKYARRRPL